MTARASTPVQPYSDDFYLECHSLVKNHFGIDLGSGVTSTNSVFVYRFLINNVN